MRILTTIIYIALMALLVSCDQQHSTSDIDPKLGLECFESQVSTLIPKRRDHVIIRRTSI